MHCGESTIDSATDGRIRAVVTDIGSVLELVEADHVSTALGEWERRLGLPAEGLHHTMGDVWSRGALGTITQDEMDRAFRDRLRVSQSDLDAFWADFWVEYLGTLNKELLDYYTALGVAGYRLGVLSNSFLGAREREQAAYGFEDLFEDLVYSHEVGLEKPDPRIYALTCHRLGLPASAVLFVDDVPENIDAARAAGMRAVRFTDTASAIAEIDGLLAAYGEPAAGASSD
jgi:epoxide hydrolase-like predicted phosphatase